MGYCGNYCNSTKVCQNDGKCVKTAGKQWDCVVFTLLHTHMNTYISNINITYIYIYIYIYKVYRITINLHKLFCSTTILPNSIPLYTFTTRNTP